VENLVVPKDNVRIYHHYAEMVILIVENNVMMEVLALLLLITEIFVHLIMEVVVHIVQNYVKYKVFLDLIVVMGLRILHKKLVIMERKMELYAFLPLVAVALIVHHHVKQ